MKSLHFVSEHLLLLPTIRCVSHSGQGTIGDQCVCYDGFTGSSCGTAAFTDYFECGYKCTFDHGVCLFSHTTGFKRYYACDCGDTGYFGASCARFQCDSDCNWNGECMEADVCHCKKFFFGTECSWPCLSRPPKTCYRLSWLQRPIL